MAEKSCVLHTLLDFTVYSNYDMCIKYNVELMNLGLDISRYKNGFQRLHVPIIGTKKKRVQLLDLS